MRNIEIRRVKQGGRVTEKRMILVIVLWHFDLLYCLYLFTWSFFRGFLSRILRLTSIEFPGRSLWLKPWRRLMWRTNGKTAPGAGSWLSRKGERHWMILIGSSSCWPRSRRVDLFDRSLQNSRRRMQHRISLVFPFLVFSSYSFNLILLMYWLIWENISLAFLG